MLSSPGVGSGLDINSIISQLMQLERQPLVRLENKKSTYEAQLSAYGKIKSALSTFQSALGNLSSTSKFKVFSATSSDETVFTAKVDSTASPGSYKITVDSLAEAEQWYSTTYADEDTVDASGGGGTLNITLGSNPAFAVNVAAGSTLNDIRDAINEATDNPGVSASIITDSGGSRLMIASQETGATNTITITGDAALANFQTANMTQLQAAADASITIGEGAGALTVTSETNTISGAIQGVTLELKSESAVGETQTLTVVKDTGAIQASVQEFINAYNEVIKTINAQRDDSSTADKKLDGPLGSDTTLVSLQNAIWTALNTPASGITSDFTYLSEVGIKTQQDGTLSLDTEALDDALTNDFNGVAELFANNPGGVLYQMEAKVDDFLSIDGLIDSREDGLNERIKSVNSQIDSMEYRLDLIEQRYKKQFWALDALVGQMNSTSSYLSQQLARF